MRGFVFGRERPKTKPLHPGGVNRMATRRNETNSLKFWCYIRSNATLKENGMSKLAIDGGSPVRSKGPIVETDVFEEEELQALLKVARQKKLRRAEATVEYEQALADWFGVKHAIAMSS